MCKQSRLFEIDGRRAKLRVAVTSFLVVIGVLHIAQDIGHESAAKENSVLSQSHPDPSDQNIILAPDQTRAAMSIDAQVGCTGVNNSIGFVKITWKTAANLGVGQRVDITIFRGGFEHQKFETSEILSADQVSFVWDRLRGQAIHFVRVLTKHKDGWVPSEIISFEGPLCIMDSRHSCVTPTP
jgi:hypothetical protein